MLEVPREFWRASPKATPKHPCEIDYNHPLAHKLEGCWVFNQPDCVDLVRGTRATLQTGATGTIELVPVREGWAHDYPGGGTANTNLTAWNAGDYDYFSFLNLDPLSVFAVGTRDDEARTGTILAKYFRAGPFIGDAYYFYANQSGQLGAQLIESGSTDRLLSYTTNRVVNLGTEYSYGFTYPQGGQNDESLGLYLDGVKQTVLTLGGADGAYQGMNNSTTDLLIGGSLANDSNFWGEWSGRLKCVYLWRRQLTPADMLTLHYSPYAFIKESGVPSLYSPAAAAAGAFPGTIASDGGPIWMARAGDPRWAQIIIDSGITTSGNFIDDVHAALEALTGTTGQLDDLWLKFKEANNVTDTSEPFTY